MAELEELINMWEFPLILIQWLKLSKFGTQLVHSLCSLRPIIKSHPKRKKTGLAVCYGSSLKVGVPL